MLLRLDEKLTHKTACKQAVGVRVDGEIDDPFQFVVRMKPS